jgi:PAT family beta-lactamase induction signal transducer AmpG
MGSDDMNESAANGRPDTSWGQAISALVSPRVITMLFLGFSAGVPILLIFSTLSVWLREADVARSSITFFSWAALGYSFKFVWAPLVDKIPLPVLTARLGRRRAWLLVSQFAVIAAILLMASSDPQADLVFVAFAAVMLGFSSATQDIVIDAYRIESAGPDLQAMMASSYIAGYRIGMLVAGAGVLYLAALFGSEETYDYSSWSLAYACMAGVMGLGVATTLIISEPEIHRPTSSAFVNTGQNLRFFGVFLCAVAAFALGFFLSAEIGNAIKTVFVEDVGMTKRLAGFLVETARLAFSVGLGAIVGWVLVAARAVPAAMVIEGYIDPLADFVRRYGKLAILVLVLIGTYRVADIVMGAVANVFYIDLGFTKLQIALYAKTYGLFATIGGSFLGGVLAVRYGVIRALFLGALLSAATNVLFAYLATQDNDTTLLMAVILADNASAGIATAAFVAYLSGLTSVSFTAVQYAIFSSVMTLVPKILAGYSGTIVDNIDYGPFFVLTAVLGVPVLFLVVWVGKAIPLQEAYSRPS